MLPYGRQTISQADIDAVTETLKGDWLTQGPMVGKFEKSLCDYTQAKHAVCVNSATSALHIACLALGLKKGDTVWTSPNSFVASANCARYCSASVDFVDIDASTGNMSILALEKKLAQAKKANRLPKIVIPVHFAGQSCDMKELYELSLVYGFKIIEDGSHALGAEYQGKAVGGCEYSDISVFSFHPVKMITTGEGGVALTNSPELAYKMRLFASHGITKQKELFSSADMPPWYYEQQSLGFNYRMSDINAALGVNQLDKLNAWVEKRNELANYYQQKLATTNIDYLDIKAGRKCSFHLFVVLVPAQLRTAIYEYLRLNNIGVQIHYIPIYKQPNFAEFNISDEDYPQTESYYEKCISLPIYPSLKQSEQDRVLAYLTKAIAAA